MANKPHHRGAFTRHSALIRRLADADPTTRCWRCGLTIAEVRSLKPQARWTAGHLVDGQQGGPLRAECSPCNFAAGARLTNTRRTKRTARTW